jgi:hypothetical protein
MFESVASGMPPESARQHVTAFGLRTRRGREVPKQTFAQMLRNPVYWGRIKTKQVEALGAFEPLTTEKLFQQVQDVIAGKRGARSARHHKTNVEFALKGLLLCHKCGRPLTAGFAKGIYPTMWCWFPGCRGYTGRREKLEGDFLGLLSAIQPTAELVSKLHQLAAGLWKARTAQLSADRKMLVQRLNDQGTLNSQAVAARVRGDISAEDFAGIKIDITKASAGYTELTGKHVVDNLVEPLLLQL